MYNKFRRFVEQGGKKRAGPGFPINCGLLVVYSELADLYDDGLALAMEFLRAGLIEEEPELRGFCARIVGQLAWNYVFANCESIRLPATLNWVPSAASSVCRTASPRAPSVLHYVGGSMKTRMLDDFACYFGADAAEEISNWLRERGL